MPIVTLDPDEPLDPVDQPAAPAAPKIVPLAPDEPLDRDRPASSWLGPPSGLWEPLDTGLQTFNAMTNAAVRAATFGLSDAMSAAIPAVRHTIERMQAPTSDAPADAIPAPETGFLPAPPAGDGSAAFSQDYQRALARQRTDETSFAADHPLLDLGATIAGAATGGAPLARGAATIPRVAGLARQALAGLGLGGLGGAAAGVTPATAEPSWGGAIEDVLGGAGAGAVAGAALPPVAALAGRLISPLTRAVAPTVQKLTGGAGAGAVAGAALPPVAALAGRLISPLTRAVAPTVQKLTGGVLGSDAAGNQAIRVIAGRIAQDAAAGGAGVNDLQTAIAAIPAGKPLALVDVGDANVQGLAGKIARQPGAGRTVALNAFGDRTGDAASRIVDDINTGITPQTAYNSEQALLAQRKAAAAPAYQNFYAQPALNPDHLEPGGALTGLMQRPSMKDAAARALKTAQEEGRDPNSLGITFNEAGDPVFQEAPSWQTLDYIKGGLDDHLDQWRDKLTGRLQLDRQGKAALGTQQTFVDFLDKNNPAYAAARDAWAGPSASLGALRQGQNFRSFLPDELKAMFNGANPQLRPSEQEFFRVGAADTMRQGAMRTGNTIGIIGSNEANNRGASLLKQQLQPLFTDPNAFNSFIGRAEAEARMLQTQARTIGGSRTSTDLAEQGSGAGGVVGPLVTGLGAAVGHEPYLAATQLATGLSRLANLPEINAPEVNRRIADRLFSADPAVQTQTLRDILALPSPAGVRAALPAGNLAAQFVPSLGPRVAPWFNQR